MAVPPGRKTTPHGTPQFIEQSQGELSFYSTHWLTNFEELQKCQPSVLTWLNTSRYAELCQTAPRQLRGTQRRLPNTRFMSGLVKRNHTCCLLGSIFPQFACLEIGGASAFSEPRISDRLALVDCSPPTCFRISDMAGELFAGYHVVRPKGTPKRLVSL